MKVIKFLRNFKKWLNEKNLIQIVELDPETKEIFKKVKPFTMTSEIRLWSMVQSLDWIINKKIDGEIVETGCWKGGNLFLCDLYLKSKGINNKKIYGYDTFSGMPLPEKNDFKWQRSFNETLERWSMNNQKNKNNWAIVNKKNVLDNIKKIKAEESIKLIEGKVEDSLLIKNNLPKKIAMLRIDTNFYKSTKFALEVLEPLVEKEGVIIFDDYGSWVGASKAIDEYFKNKFVWLHRVDRGSRLLIKQ